MSERERVADLYRWAAEDGIPDDEWAPVSVTTMRAIRRERDDLYEAARYVCQLANQPGMDDDEWEQAITALEAALATPEPPLDEYEEATAAAMNYGDGERGE